MSLKKRTVGRVIGERRLTLQETPGKSLVVTLGHPRMMKGHVDWECPFRIKGSGLDRLEFGYGVDALQALTNALEGIRWVLDRVKSPLAWSGVLSDRSGFQRIVPLLPGISERLERSLDREISRHLRRLKQGRKKRFVGQCRTEGTVGPEGNVEPDRARLDSLASHHDRSLPTARPGEPSCSQGTLHEM